MLFRASGYLFTVGIERIIEVLPPRSITPLPGSEPFVAGIVNVRGRIVTVIDLGTRLDLPPVLAGAESQLLVLEYREAPIGLAVSEVLRILSLSPAELDRSAAVVDGLRLDRPHFSGVGEIDGRLYAALDLDEILSPIMISQ